MNKTILNIGLFTLVFGIACLTGEIIGCFLSPINGILWFLGTTSHISLKFLLNIPMYLIAAGILITSAAILSRKKQIAPSESSITLVGLPKMKRWKKRRTLFQLGILGLILIHILLSIANLTEIKGVCPRSLGDDALKGQLGTSALFWASTIVLTFLWGRALCGWICVYAPVQENAANLLTAVGHNPLRKAFIQKGFIYIITPIFWLSIIYNLMKNADILTFSTIGGDKPNDLWLYVGGLITMFPLTLFFVNALGSRFFCKYVCPLGGLLSLIAPLSFLKIHIKHDKCKNCGICTKNCQMGVPIDTYISKRNLTIKNANCLVCGDCIDSCPSAALGFGIFNPKKNLQEAGGDRIKKAS